MSTAILLALLACSDGAAPPRAPTVPVVVAPVSRGEATVTVILDGEVSDPLEAQVGAEVAGTVVAIPGRLGAPVERGSTVVELDPRPFRIALAQATGGLAAAQAEVAVRQAARDRARAAHDRVTEVAGRDPRAVSSREADDVRLALAEAEAALGAAQAQVMVRRAAVDAADLDLARCAMRTPVDGVVSRQDARLGMRLGVGTPVFGVSATAALEVMLDAGEAWAGRVMPGAPVVVTVPGRPNLSTTGEVAGVAASAQGVGRSQRVRVALPDVPAGLMPGLGVRGEISVTHLGDALSVPRDAIVNGAVFVVDGGTARRVPVEVIDAGRDRVVVAADLAGTESVVVRGNEALSDGASVAVVGGPSAAAAAASPPNPSSPRP